MDGFSSDFSFNLGDLAALGLEGNPTLSRNLRAISRRSPDAARRIEAAPPLSGVEWVPSEEGRPGLVVVESSGVVADPFGLGGPAELTRRVLASRRRPVTEARRLVESIDPLETGAACVLGFGAGYHCEALAERLGTLGVVVCFEPDLSLLRAVLEREDHSGWIEKTNFILLTDAADRPAISSAIRGLEGIISIGVRIVEHHASRSRLGERADRFAAAFADAMRTMRTSVVTTLVRSQATLSNLIMNADRYAASEGIESLRGAAFGRPGIVVSAGPSLERNVHLLEDPSVREHAVIIAVQTTLKPLLRRGIKPHFVCALDYHELSRRFYEGLTASDVEGVTLVVEPKANPSIIEAFPGRIRCVQEPLLDQLLGPDLAGQKWPLKAGATVAHLCAYLARHLGCDPLILIGQDLGFSDGQYYSAGAAIHDVWAGELGPMRTLEMFEWERIVRERPLLRRLEDVHGRPIYTDEQMSAYLSQFEVDFAADAERGLRVIDATEGGVRKAHTSVMSLTEALERHACGEPLALDTGGPARGREGVAERSASRLEQIAEQADAVESCSRRAARLLSQMIKVGPGTGATNVLIDEVYGVRDEVRALEPAYGLVQFANQAAAMRRFKADRSIELRDLSENDRQTAQIERDRVNVEFTADAAAELARLLRDAAGAFRGERARVVADEAPIDGGDDPRIRVAALVMYDDQVTGLGLDRRGGSAGGSTLPETVARLLRAGELDQIVIATGAPEAVRAMLGPAADHPGLLIEHVDGTRLRERTRAVGRARLLAPDTWRTGLGGLSCYDESFDPTIAADVMDALSIDAAVLVGPDWAMVDPGIIDALARRARERPDVVKLSISQAAPGLGGILLDRATMRSIAGSTAQALNFGSIGGLLAYLPIAPQADPIAKAFCVTVPPLVRDAGRRFIADTPAGKTILGRVRDRLGPAIERASAAEVVAAAGGKRAEAPRHVELELCTGRLAGGLFARWLGGDDRDERPVMPTDVAVRIVRSLAAGRPDTLLTLHGAGDPLMHPGVFDVIEAARSAGVGLVHLRTDGLCEAFDPRRLLASGVDVVSIDLLAVSPRTYCEVAGVDRYDEVKGRVEALLAARTIEAGLPSLWVVPRITRCDETATEIDAFYDGWLMAAGAAVIDAIPDGAEIAETARIRPLPLPELAQARTLRQTLIVRSDGRALATDGTVLGDLTTDPIERVWRALGRGARAAA